MTQIEDLVREALASTPNPPATTDPLGGIDRRVRRARRRLAAGAGVVTVVIAAAIVIPLTVGGGGTPRNVQVVTPQPSATPSPPPAGTTALWTGTAVWASTSPSGQRWLLYNDGGQDYVTRVSGKTEKPVAIAASADYLLAGDNVIWTVGDGGAGQSVSRIAALDVRTGQVRIRTFDPGQHLSFGAVIGDYLFVDVSDGSGDHVDALYADGDQIKTYASRPEPHAAEMVLDGGAIWVHAGDNLQELFVSERGIDVGPRVPWGSGQIFAPALPRSAGPQGIWAYDGSRLIGLMPSALSQCVSCAEGDRVTVPGKPSSVVEEKDGLYVAVPGSGLYFYSADALGSGATPVTASIKGVQVITLTADPVGGVDYVDDQGNLIHWQPVAR